MKSSETLKIAIFSTFFATTVSAHANLRAPGVIYKEISSALHPNNQLVVHKEKLDLNCDVDICKIKAHYLVHSENQQTLSFSFLMPDQVPVNVMINQVSSPTTISTFKTTTQYQESLVSGSRFYSSSRENNKLHQAIFEGILQKGKNEIEISYEQPLSGYEMDYGYFKDGRFIYYMQYEIWPLKQWTLDKDFVLNIDARFTPKEMPGWWKRTFGTIKIMKCHTVLPNNRTLLKIAKDTHQGEFIAQDLPDKLYCMIGDEDLIKNLVKGLD